MQTTQKRKNTYYVLAESSRWPLHRRRNTKKKNCTRIRKEKMRKVGSKAQMQARKSYSKGVHSIKYYRICYKADEPGTLSHYVRARPVMKGFQRRIGHAPINFTNLDSIFGHGVVHALIDALGFGPLFLFLLCKRYNGSNDPKKYKKATKTCPPPKTKL